MSSPATLLNVPYHRQDCPGYCALGCVTMILDANRMIPPGGYSQVAAYTRVYRQAGPPGSSSPAGDYDRWHVSPWQLQTLLQPLSYEVHRDSGSAGVDRLLQKVRQGLDRGKPAIALLSYDGVSPTGKIRASGTHWVVVYGYTHDGKDVTGYYTRDPWRGGALPSREDPAFKHLTNHHGTCLCGTAGGSEAIASWQRSPFEGPDTPGTASGIPASALNKGMVGGIRTDGHAYVLTVDPHASPPANPPEEEIAGVVPIKINVVDWPKLLQPLFINGMEAGGSSASVPPEFAQAMAGVTHFVEEDVVRTDGTGNGSYRLTIYEFPFANPNSNSRIRLVAWSSASPAMAGHTLDGASVLTQRWPGIHPRVNGMLVSGGEFKLVAPAPDPDPDWQELNDFYDRLQSFVHDFNNNPLKEIRVQRLVWEPCIISLSPALPFYDAEILLPAVDTKPPRTIRVLIDLKGHIYHRLRRSSKAGA